MLLSATKLEFLNLFFPMKYSQITYAIQELFLSHFHCPYKEKHKLGHPWCRRTLADQKFLKQLDFVLILKSSKPNLSSNNSQLLFLTYLYKILLKDVSYGITGYGVSRPEIQNQKDFCIKFNIPLRQFLHFENWTNGEPQYLAKIRVFKIDYF